MKPGPAKAFGADFGPLPTMPSPQAPPAARGPANALVPPHDTAAEQAVFRGLIYEPGAFARVSGLSTDDFYETRHQLLWGVIARSNAEGVSPDAALLAHLVGSNGAAARIGGEAYLAELAREGLPSATLIEHHAAIVKEKSVRRKVLAAAQALAAAAHEPGVDIAAFTSEETVYLREVLAEAPGGPRLDLARIAPTLPDVLAEPDPAQAWAIDGLLERGGGMLLYGPSYVGKSLTAWYAALCVARGYGSILNHGVEAPPENVVVFYGESTRKQVKDAFRKFLTGEAGIPDTLRLVDAHAIEPFPDLSTAEGRAWYEAVLLEAGARFAVFDSSTALVGDDMNDGRVAGTVMQFLSRLGKRHGISRILVHHTRKASTRGDEGSSADRAAGHATWHRLADTAVCIDDEGDYRIRVSPWKIRNSEPDKPFFAQLDRETLRFEFVAVAGHKKKSSGSSTGPEPAVTPFQILEAIRDFGVLTSKELQEKFGVGRDTLRRRTTSGEFSGWLAQGIVTRDEPRGRTPEAYRFVGPMPS